MGTRPVLRRRLQLSLSEGTVGSLLSVGTALFMVVGATTLHFAPYPLGLRAWHLIAVVGGWALAWGCSTWVLRSRLQSYDPIILPLVALLSGWGLLLQTRLAPALFLKQILWLLIGCGVMCAVALTPNLTRTIRRYRYTLLTAGIVLLGATLVFGVNPSGYGQQLWLGAFGVYLQPSEPLKLLLVVYLAAYLAEKRDLPKIKAAGESMWLVVLGPMAAMVGLALLLLGWQQDLGAAMLYYLTFVTMIYLAWGNGWYVVLSLGLFAPVALAGCLLSDRVALRVSIWLDPWAPAQADRAFQIRQSLFAFGSGGLFGTGLGQGSPGLIPAVHTDFVYAAIAEELGLVGALGLVVLVAALAHRGIRLAQRSESAFESLVAGGIAAVIGLQTWVIGGGNAKLIPITGVTLPFLSYGGSSLVTMLCATGVLINLSTPHPLPLSLSIMPGANRPLKYTAARLGHGLLALLGSLALITGFWCIVRAEGLQLFPGNPRFVLSEARIRRGRILDRNADVLADITIDEQGYVTRQYPVPEAASVLGFASLAYGTEGIEGACGIRLRGELGQSELNRLRQSLLHEDPVGRDVRLTIDARLQQQAQHSLGGLVGAVVLVDARTGEILALASNPIYESASIDEEWPALSEAVDSPFLNRATQGLAQPGSSLQPFILAAALAQDPETLPAVPLTAAVPINGMSITCRDAPGDSDWPSALASACPAPFLGVARELGDAGFEDILRRWGLLDAPTLVLPTVAADLAGTALRPEVDALGQGELLVTPLQMVQAMAALGNDGVRPGLSLLDTPLEGCTPVTPSAGIQVVDANAAAQVRQMLAKYEGAVGHVGTSLAGPGRQQAWFVGLNSADVPRYAVAVLVDQMQDPQVAAKIGADLLRLLIELQQVDPQVMSLARPNHG